MIDYVHWRRLVKNIGGQSQIVWERNVVKTDKCIGVSQLLGGGRAPRLTPKSAPMATRGGSDTGAYGKPVQLLQRRSDVVSGTRVFY